MRFFSRVTFLCDLPGARTPWEPESRKKDADLGAFPVFQLVSAHFTAFRACVWESAIAAVIAQRTFIISYIAPLPICVLPAQLLLCFLCVYSCVVKRATSIRQKSKAQARSCFADFTFSVPIGFIFGTEKSVIYVCYTAAAILSFILSFVFFLQDNQIFTMKSKISQQNNSGAFMNAVLYTF
jgi:uncharacterized membrane protein